MAGQASSSSASLGLSARIRKERLGPAVLSGFVATTAMAVVALLAYAIALGLGGATGNTVQRWLYALAHNPVMTMVHASPLGAVGINLGAGLGVGFGLLLGGGAMLVTTLVIGSSMMDIVGGVVGGAVVGAALGLVLGSISSLSTEMKRAPVVASSVVIQPMMPPE